MVYKTKNNKTKTQHNIYWANQHTQIIYVVFPLYSVLKAVIDAVIVLYYDLHLPKQSVPTTSIALSCVDVYLIKLYVIN
jgi:hypothetical protein